MTPHAAPCTHLVQLAAVLTRILHSFIKEFPNCPDTFLHGISSSFFIPLLHFLLFAFVLTTSMIIHITTMIMMITIIYFPLNTYTHTRIHFLEKAQKTTLLHIFIIFFLSNSYIRCCRVHTGTF